MRKREREKECCIIPPHGEQVSPVRGRVREDGRVASPLSLADSGCGMQCLRAKQELRLPLISGVESALERGEFAEERRNDEGGIHLARVPGLHVGVAVVDHHGELCGERGRDRERVRERAVKEREGGAMCLSNLLQECLHLRQ